MKFSELKGRAVINLEEARKIGEVEDLLLQPQDHKIVTLKVKTGLFSASQLLPIANVRSVGPDAITVSHDPTAEQKEASTDIGAVTSAGLAVLLPITEILGDKVVSHTGALVGEVHDAILDMSEFTVTGYEVKEGGLFGKTQEVAATSDVRYGDKMLTLPVQLSAE